MLRDINLEVKRGEFVIIIGEIGSGKSSLISAILGEMLYIPQNEIECLGGFEKVLSDKDVDQLNHVLYNLEEVESDDKYPLQINSSMSFVEQQPWIQNLTLRENILFGLDLDKRRYVETLLAC